MFPVFMECSFYGEDRYKEINELVSGTDKISEEKVGKGTE